MSSFEEFMDEVEESPTKALPASNTTLSTIQLALTTTVKGLLAPLSISSSEQQKFSEKVSSLVQDKTFLSEFSDQIGEPLEDESEDEFVKRGSDKLRKMLYGKFNIR
ncbi:hypothetical protein H6F86_24380 [Phormidium sp. FACHB-592]|uniref:Uncharacterized protein n=1 Tax=Stenomitos frigidus AS-A4 TaxID=2933935 RepID=A0ABV0KKZ5_9CYAN|nr:hypothetical protein [Phormidium sp. FACHB-592]MBD2076965.1 hypothetical protein [Phormidium sp. FACHB-592]